MNTITLWLDNYTDIYSDFDSRHYLKRRISEDFLLEIRTEINNSSSTFNNIELLLPSAMRNTETEKIIAEGLNNYFKKQYHIQQNKCSDKFKNGLKLFIIGVIVMLLNTWVSNYFKESFHIIFLRILLEPAGWFLLWAAFDFLFYDYKKLKLESNFYKQMSKTTINFNNAT
jgi:hypothetical protein